MSLVKSLSVMLLASVACDFVVSTGYTADREPRSGGRRAARRAMPNTLKNPASSSADQLTLDPSTTPDRTPRASRSCRAAIPSFEPPPLTVPTDAPASPLSSTAALAVATASTSEAAPSTTALLGMMFNATARAVGNFLNAPDVPPASVEDLPPPHPSTPGSSPAASDREPPSTVADASDDAAHSTSSSAALKDLATTPSDAALAADDSAAPSASPVPAAAPAPAAVEVSEKDGEPSADPAIAVPSAADFAPEPLVPLRSLVHEENKDHLAALLGTRSSTRSSGSAKPVFGGSGVMDEDHERDGVVSDPSSATATADAAAGDVDAKGGSESGDSSGEDSEDDQAIPDGADTPPSDGTETAPAKGISLTDSVSLLPADDLQRQCRIIEGRLPDHAQLTTTRAREYKLPDRVELVALAVSPSDDTDMARLSRLVAENSAECYGHPDVFAERRRQVIQACAARGLGLQKKIADDRLTGLDQLVKQLEKEERHCSDTAVFTLHVMDLTHQVVLYIDSSTRVTQEAISLLEARLKTETSPVVQTRYRHQIKELTSNIERFQARRMQTLTILSSLFPVPEAGGQSVLQRWARRFMPPRTSVTFVQAPSSSDLGDLTHIPTRVSDDLSNRVESVFGNYARRILSGRDDIVSQAQQARRIVEVRTTASAPAASSGGGAAAASAASETGPAAAADSATGLTTTTIDPAPTPGADDA